MKGSYMVATFIALVAFAHALPAAEESWSDSDELLARVFSDPTPVSLMQKEADLNAEDHQKRIDEASDEANTLDAEAKKGKGKRKEFRKEQKKFEKQAKKLNDKQEKLALKAQSKNV